MPCTGVGIDAVTVFDTVINAVINAVGCVVGIAVLCYLLSVLRLASVFYRALCPCVLAFLRILRYSVSVLVTSLLSSCACALIKEKRREKR